MKSVRDEKADRQMDRMLSLALTQQAKPDAALQQRVCSQSVEGETGNESKQEMDDSGGGGSVCAGSDGECGSGEPLFE